MNCTDIATLAPLYLSGELDRTRATAFDTHLKTCPQCFAELARQARLDAALGESMLSEGVDAAAIDRRVRERIAAESAAKVQPTPPKQAPRRWVIAVMGAAAVLLLTALGYRLLMGPEVVRVYAEAARDHRREVVEQQPRKWVSDPAQITATAEQRGVPRSVVLALAGQGYHLERGRLCFVGRRVFVHLVYSSAGHEFSVYLRQRNAEALPGAIRETANDNPLRVSNEGSQYVASVETARLTVLVVNDQSAGAALDFARFASTVL